MNKLAMLIIDDQDEVLSVYKEVLGEDLGHEVECVYSPGEALHHVKNRLFDIVMVDAKISHQEATYGGLILAQQISTILGNDAVILMSQFNVKSKIARLNKALNFLPKPPDGSNFLAWVHKELMGKIGKLVERQYGFVIMPYNNAEGDAWYRDKLVPWMKDAGFTVKRMDELATTRAINTEMLTKIDDAHFSVVYESQQNPNVFFEAGYASAKEKYLILFNPEVENRPFDIQANRVLVVGGPDEQRERQELLEFMGDLRQGVSGRGD